MQNNHIHKELAPLSISKIAELTNQANFDHVLEGILIPRVVGTETHEKVKDFIMDEMTKLKWNVEVDEFIDDTPIFKSLKFSNIIATLNPNAERFLVLSCHYDSKYFKDEVFLAATDSAVPCAMMINLAHVMSEALEKVQNSSDVSLKFVFFDGEEAFHEWSDDDSIYGARHLAAKWEKEEFLHRIDIMILLDLLGAPDPAFYSYFRETDKWYTRLINAEERLDSQKLFARYQSSGVTNRNPSRIFQPHSFQAGIQDDHIPFLRRGVPIIHLIPSPFPQVWHKLDDNREAIDTTTVENLSKIIRVFVAEYLHLDV